MNNKIEIANSAGSQRPLDYKLAPCFPCEGKVFPCLKAKVFFALHKRDATHQREEESRPIIFIKKINDKSKTIPLNTPNSLGHIRHFPAATKE